MKKAKYTSVHDFDPRPIQYRGTAQTQLETFLSKMKGKELGVSLLFDLPNKQQLEESIGQFKLSLSLPEEKIKEIEINTRDQRNSPLWFLSRKYRLTASTFGEIYHRRPDTPPDCIVLRLLKGKQFSSPALEWEIQNEHLAVQAYIAYQQLNGHLKLSVDPVGFLISKTHPFLGASPDGSVYDPITEDLYLDILR